MGVTREAGGLFALALAVRALYLATARGVWITGPLIDADMLDYQGELVAHGIGLPPGPFWQPPAYPLLLGLLYRLFGHALWAPRALQALLGAATSALVFLLAHRVTGARRASLAAGVFCALHGPLVFYTGELLPTTLGAFLITLALFRASSPPGLEAAAQAGVAAGAAGAALPAVLPAGIAVAWLASGGLGRKGARLAAVALGAAALTLAPVAVANHARSGEWVLVSANAGVNLWIGNNPRGDQLELARPGEGWEALMGEAEGAGAESLAEADRFFRRRALSFCADEPLPCLAGLAHKARLLLTSRELPRNEDMRVVRRGSPVLSALTAHAGPAHLPYALLLPLGIAGAASLFARRRGGEGPTDGDRVGRGLTLAALLLALVPVAFFVTGRYRAPLAPALCALAAPGLLAVSRRERFPLVLAAASLALACLPVRVATDEVDFEAEALYVAGGRRARLGDDQGAAEAWKQALDRRPGYLEAAVNLGLADERLGRLDEAREAYRRVLSLRPSHPLARERLEALGRGPK